MNGSASTAIPLKVEIQKFGQEQKYHVEKEKGMDKKETFFIISELNPSTLNVQMQHGQLIYLPPQSAIKLQQYYRRQVQFARRLGAMMVRMIAGAIPDLVFVILQF